MGHYMSRKKKEGEKGKSNKLIQIFLLETLSFLINAFFYRMECKCIPLCLLHNEAVHGWKLEKYSAKK